MDNSGSGENSDLPADLFPKTTNVIVHSTLTPVQLDGFVNIPDGQGQEDNHLFAGMDCYCRICGSENEQLGLISIFGDQGRQLELGRKIAKHLSFQVEQDDRLPQQACATCVCHLNICHHLYEISQAANSKLRHMFLLQVEESTAADNNTCINVQEIDSADSNIADCEGDGNLSNATKEDEKSFKPDKSEEAKCVESSLCHVCGKHFKHASSLQAHRRTHLADSLKKRHHCLLCPKSFRSKFHLSEHRNFHEGLTPYSCKACGKAFHKRAQLRQHETIHTSDSQKHVCEVCGMRFSRRGNLMAHGRTHAENRSFACRLCGMGFPTTGAMLSHRRSHTQDDIRNSPTKTGLGQVFTCGMCGKLLTNRDSLVSHLEQHGPKEATEHQCQECGKMLRSRRSLEYHRRSQHSGERAFHCSHCPEGFMTRKLLQAHEARHTGDKPFKCETCWKGFRSQNNLKQHMLKHNAEKNFECLVCGKRFFRKGALTVHTRKHTGEKPFICDLCGRPFSQKNDMLKHQKTHQEPNTRSRTCDVCTTVFSSKKELAKHRDSAHKESVEIVPLIITNNVFETHIITEDGQKIVFTTVEALGDNNLATPSTSI